MTEVPSERAAPPAPWTGALAALRAAGWSVAVHNDYELRGRLLTFWLLTRKGGLCVKGEGVCDAAALAECLAGAGLPAPVAVEADPAAAALDRLRAEGWQVGLHNDYRLGGEPRTFWRLVHPRSGRYADGEGDADAAALEAASASGLHRVPLDDDGSGHATAGGLAAV